MDRSAADSAPDGPGAGGRLAGRALAVLQLVARGYTPAQIAALFDVRVAEVVGDLRSAAAALGADSVPAAVAEAARRGQID